MFDSWKISHSVVAERLAAQVAKLSLRAVSDAFVASLGTRALHTRSAFGSYAVFRNFKLHSAENRGSSCRVCGVGVSEKVEDLNILSFERVKWGGVRHDDPVYALFDLEQFCKYPPTAPTEADVNLLRELFDRIENAPNGITAAAIHEHFPRSIRSNKPERDAIVQMLGYAGILSVPGHPGFNSEFVAHFRRELPDRHFVDMSYPAAWWTTNMGINKIALQECFGQHLGTGV